MRSLVATSLLASIDELGLLHPLVAKKGTLIAGTRGLDAVKRLGRTEILVNIVRPDAAGGGLKSWSQRARSGAWSAPHPKGALGALICGIVSIAALGSDC